jgi:hypothetical protein
MPRCGATFDENGVGVAQTAASVGLRLFVSGPRTAADQLRNSWFALRGSVFRGVFMAALRTPARLF